MIGTLDPSEIERILRTEPIGRLGLCGEGRVYVYPVNFGYDGTDLYIQSRQGEKIDLMRAHPEICLEVEEIASPAHWRTVLVHGRFEELLSESARDAALAVIVGQGGRPHPPSLAPYMDGPEQIVIYRIQLREKTGRYEQDVPFPQYSTR